jgi:hypothetical protein
MRPLAVCALALALSACASAPPYQPAASSLASGYSDQRLASDRYRVRFTGTERMSAAEVQDYALLRAAQLTLENGHDWFEVVASDTVSDTEERRSLDTGFGPDYRLTRSCGLLGCTTTAQPVLAPSRTETVESRTRFEHVMEIRTGQGEPLAGNARTYDAAETFANLSARLTS